MLAETLSFFGVPTSERQAAAFCARHLEVYPRVTEFRKELLDEHFKNNKVKLLTGRHRHLPDIDWNAKFSVHKAETTLSNNVVQGAGQDFLKAAIIRADYRCANPDRVMRDSGIKLTKDHRLYLKDKERVLNKYRRILKKAKCDYLLQVHDEAIFTCVPEAAAECLELLAGIMSWRHYFPITTDYNVPLVAEGGIGDTWKIAKSEDAELTTSAGFEDWEKYAK